MGRWDKSLTSRLGSPSWKTLGVNLSHLEVEHYVVEGDHQYIGGLDLLLDSLLSIFVSGGRGLCPVPVHRQTGAEAELGARQGVGSCCPPAFAFCPG